MVDICVVKVEFMHDVFFFLISNRIIFINEICVEWSTKDQCSKGTSKVLRGGLLGKYQYS